MIEISQIYFATQRDTKSYKVDNELIIKALVETKCIEEAELIELLNYEDDRLNLDLLSDLASEHEGELFDYFENNIPYLAVETTKIMDYQYGGYQTKEVD